MAPDRAGILARGPRSWRRRASKVLLLDERDRAEGRSTQGKLRHRNRSSRSGRAGTARRHAPRCSGAQGPRRIFDAGEISDDALDSVRGDSPGIPTRGPESAVGGRASVRNPDNAPRGDRHPRAVAGAPAFCITYASCLVDVPVSLPRSNCPATGRPAIPGWITLDELDAWPLRLPHRRSARDRAQVRSQQR